MKTFYFLLIITIFTSCASLKPDKFTNGQIELTKENLILINGKYDRNSVKRKGDLFWNFYTKGYDLGTDSLQSVELNVIDEKHLKVSIMKNDSIIDSKSFKGKLKHGYFEMKRKTFFLPTIYLNVFRTTKFRVGLLENKNLTTDYKQIAFGTGFMIIPFIDKETELDFEYKKHN